MERKKYCSHCKTENADGYCIFSRKLTKLGELKEYYLCRKCNAERANKYYHKNKTRVRAIKTKYEKKNKLQRHAWSAVRQAIIAGIVLKPKACSKCGGKTRRIEAHHEDHRKKLDIVWLCTPCHADTEKVLRTTKKLTIV